MSLAALKKMADLGLTIEQAIEVMEAMNEGGRSKNAERQARFRARKAESVTDGVTCNVTEDVTSSLSPSPPPQTPPPRPHTHGDIYTPRAKAGPDDRFAAFWAAYPLRKARRSAEAAFAKALTRISDDDPLAVILAGIERALPGWDDPRFIPHAASWLNADRWTDEAPSPRTRAPNDRSSAKLEHFDGVARAMAAACEPDQHDGRDHWQPGDGGRMRALPSAA